MGRWLKVVAFYNYRERSLLSLGSVKAIIRVIFTAFPYRIGEVAPFVSLPYSL